MFAIKKNVPKINKSFMVILAFAIYLIYKFTYIAITKISKTGNDLIFSNKVAVSYTLFGLLATILFIVAYYLIFIKQMKLEKIFLIYFPLVAIVYMLMILPGGVPDEPVHYWSAYKISNFILFNFKQFGNEGVVFRAEDANNSLLYTTMNSQNYAEFVKNFNFFAINDGTYQSLPYQTATSNTLFGYLPSAVGIAIGRIFNLSMPMVFYFGRFSNIVLYTFIVYNAIKITPIGKNFIFVYSFLPMNLHLTASFSYDVIINALAALFVAEFLRLYYGSTEIGVKDMLKLCIYAFILAPSKIVYLPITLLPLLLKKTRFQEKYQSKHLYLKLSVFVSALICLLIFQLPRLLSFGSDVASNHIISWANEEGFSLGYALSNPLKTIEIYINTFRVKGSFYIESIIGASLCWFNLNMHFFAYLPFIILIILSLLKVEGQSVSFSFWEKAFMILLFVISTGLILTSMFLAWTPKSYTAIEGVQGRYFLPLLPLVFLVLRTDGLIIRLKTTNYITLMTLFYSVYYISEMFISAFV